MKLQHVLSALLVVLALVALAGCMQETPYYPPQAATPDGPIGTSAFQSGEASKSGLTPVDNQKGKDVVTPADTGAAAEDATTQDADANGDSVDAINWDDWPT